MLIMNRRTPEIETERLCLRPLEASDLEAWHRVIFTDPEVTRYLPVREPIPKDRAAERLPALVQSWRDRGFGVWAVLERDSNELIGHCGFVTPEDPNQIELIYAFGRDRWERGYATEAAAACLRYGFAALGVQDVVALAFRENEPSIRVMLKLGFAFDGTTRRFGADLLRYRVTPEAFRASPSTRPGMTR
jgi:[ribosomal protein S5]-alanine N-acetyltransferase